MIFLNRILTFVSLVAFSVSVALADEDKSDTRPGIAPDIREDETKLKMQRGDFVVVPIPISNPTLHTGLVLGAAYLWWSSQKALRQREATRRSPDDSGQEQGPGSDEAGLQE